MATSVRMTAISTLLSVLVTPLLFALWASMNSETSAVFEYIMIDPLRMVMALLIMPVAAGMLIRARHPAIANTIRPWARYIARAVFAVVVAILLLGNAKVLGSFARIALPLIPITFAIAVCKGWTARKQGVDCPKK